MRRAGGNPTDVEVLDIINKNEDDSGTIDFPVSGEDHGAVMRVCAGVLLPDGRVLQGRPGDALQGDLQGVQQGRGGLHPRRGDQVSCWAKLCTSSFCPV